MEEMISSTNILSLYEIYNFAKKSIKSAGFEQEGQWQVGLNFHHFSETDLLRESAWVILCSGFKEKIIRKIFNYISLCFCDWESAKEIAVNENLCRETALSQINNRQKVNAIIQVAHIIFATGFEQLKKRIIKNPINELKLFPYIGDITSYHLAKNLGFPLAKPDRHLARLASWIGFNDVQTLCGTLSKHTGDPISYVDLVLWRFATLQPAYLQTWQKKVTH